MRERNRRTGVQLTRHRYSHQSMTIVRDVGQACTHAQPRTQADARTLSHACVTTRPRTVTRTRAHTRTHARTHTLTRARSTHTHTRASVCACAYARVCVLSGSCCVLTADHMAALFHMAVAHKKKIGAKFQLLIEPKPREPTKHQ